MATIDADTHFIETLETWDDVPQAMRPKLLAATTHESEQYWLIDGIHWRRDSVQGLDTPKEAREGTDISTRLAQMDELGVDVQVAFPTVFLGPVTKHREVELALCRSYNKWAADNCNKSGGRVRWVVIPPIHARKSAIRKELEFGLENGACGVFMRPIEDVGRLSHPSIQPVFELAEELGLPICIHSGNGSRAWLETFGEHTSFGSFKIAGVLAFHDLLYTNLPDRYPRLSWGFLEFNAQWLPFALYDLKLRHLSPTGHHIDIDGILARNRIFVACQATDDLGHILSYVGSESLVVGSDYGHHDTSADLQVMKSLRARDDLSDSDILNITELSPARLYPLD